MTVNMQKTALRLSIRLVMFLLCFIAGLLLLAAVPGRNVYAESTAKITSPADEAEVTVGSEFKIKITSYPYSDHPYTSYFLYYKITSPSGAISFGVKEADHEMYHTIPCTPTEKGWYLIEAARAKKKNLTEDPFTAHASIRVKARRSIADATVSGISGCVYNGQEQTQNITVELDGNTLEKGKDYTVSYNNNINAGTAEMTITGTDLYKDSIQKTFQISGFPLPEGCASSIPDIVYPGKFKYAKPEPVITVNGSVLVKDTDYELSYENNSDAGTASVIVTGKGNYSGSVTVPFQITKASIRNAVISDITPKKYTGNEIRNVLSISYNGQGIYEYRGEGSSEGKDYTAVFENNINPGTATITITGINNFKGTVTRTFTILEPSASAGISGAKILSPKANSSYPVGSEITVTATSGIYKEQYVTGLAVGVNFIFIKVTRNNERVLYTDGSDAQSKLLSIKSSGQEVSATFTAQEPGEYLIQAEWDPFSNYELRTGGFTYIPVSYDNFRADDSIKVFVGVDNPSAVKDIASANVSGITDKGYTGSSITQNPTVKLDGKTLTRNTDYYLTYTNNIRIGEASVTIHGKGNYTGTTSRTFQITAQDLTKAKIVLSPAAFTYNGSLQKPDVSVESDGTKLIPGEDYTLENAGGTEPGTYQVSITAVDGSYCTGTASKSYTIGKIPLESAVVKAEKTSCTYDGTAKKPAVTVSLNGTTLPADVYTVSYSNNVNAGNKAVITVTAKQNSFYKGSASTTFTITAQDIASDNISVEPIASPTYNRKAQTPVPSIRFGDKSLSKGTDFDLQYAQNTNAGKASVTISGKGNFKGSRTAQFSIEKKNIADASITVETIPKQTYQKGSACTPSVTVKDGGSALGKNDVQIAYQNNDKPGTASVILTGTGNYTGSRNDIRFEIVKAEDTADHAANPQTGNNNTPEESLSDKIKTIENDKDTSQYLPKDQEDLQKAIDNAKEILKDDKASDSEISKALEDLDKVQKQAEQNIKTNEKDKSTSSSSGSSGNPVISGISGDSGSSHSSGSSKKVLPVFATVEKAILGNSKDSDPKGSDFKTLTLRSPKQGKKDISLQWSKVKDASEYIVYASKCGKKNKIQKVAAVKAPKTSYKYNNLKKGTYYKFVVVAVTKTTAGEKAAGISRMIHVATKGGKVGNPKSVTLKIKKGKKKKTVRKSVTLKKGKTLKLIAKYKAPSKKKIKKHVAIRFESTDTSIASISRKGVIKGKKKGSCTIYAYAQNGIYKKFKVIVK